MRKFILALLFACPVALATEAGFIIRVDGITCPFCIATSERALSKIAGVTSVKSDLSSGTIYVCAAESTDLSPRVLARLFRDKGFNYRSVRRESTCRASDGSPLPAQPAHDHSGH